MPSKDGDRSKFFPAIEKKYGEKVSFWITRLKELETTKYPEQIAYLKENYGFSQAHANALVMYARGSTSSKKFDTPVTYFKGLEPKTRATMKAIFAAVTEMNSDLELVMAWNQPMLRMGKGYVLGASLSKNHLTLNTFSTEVLEKHLKKLSGYEVNKHTVIVPLDWKVDGPLLRSMAKARITEIQETQRH
jgi:uncharacterized protein YdhG (YjbR/CyaY superfamily)